MVCSVCSTSKVVGLFSLMIVSVPFPAELKASIVLGLNTAPSDAPSKGSVVITLPVSAFIITITPGAGVRHATKRTRFFSSKARPAGVPFLSPSS